MTRKNKLKAVSVRRDEVQKKPSGFALAIILGVLIGVAAIAIIVTLINNTNISGNVVEGEDEFPVPAELPQLPPAEEIIEVPFLPEMAPPEPEAPIPEESLMSPEIGTDFESNGITVTSSDEVTMLLFASSEMVDMNFEPGDRATLEVSGLIPNTNYYEYEGDYHGRENLTSDDSGTLSFDVDIGLESETHVWLQNLPSTKFIKDDISGGDCIVIGNWDWDSKTCVLTQDLDETVQIDSSSITFDCNGHSITGSETGNGIYFTGRAGVTVKNCQISNFVYGIYMQNSSGSSFISNTIDTQRGVTADCTNHKCDSLVFDSNVINTNGTGSNWGIYVYGASDNNLFTSNIIATDGNGTTTSGNNYGLFVSGGGSNNMFRYNNISTHGFGYNAHGIYLQNAISLNNIFEYNNVSTNGDYTNYGILTGGNNTVIRHNRVSTNGVKVYYGSNNYGISLGGYYNDVSSNIVSTNGTTYNYGINLNIYESTVTDNIVVTSGTSVNYGISIYGSSNVFRDNDITTLGGHGLVVGTSGANYLTRYNLIESNTINADGYGVYFMYNANNNTLLSNYINSTSYGVGEYASRNLTIVSNIINSGSIGVRLEYSDNNVSFNTITTDGGKSNSNHGIYISGDLVQGLVNNVIYSNTISTNGGSSNYGIVVSACNETIISKNNIVTNGTTSNVGISVTGGYNEITSNTISTDGNGTGSGANYGINAGTGQNNVANNIIHTNGAGTSNHGIVSGSYNNLVSNEIYTDGTYYNSGIYINTGNSSAVSNRVHTNGKTTGAYGNYGIDARVSSNSILSNEVYVNGSSAGQYGVYVNGNNHTVESNNIYVDGPSDNIGLRFDTTYNCSARDNTIYTGGTIRNYGVSLLNSGRYGGNFVGSNEIHASGASDNVGVYIQNSPNNVINANNVNVDGVSGDYGIYLHTVSTSNTISSNTLNVNNGMGVYSRASGVSAPSNCSYQRNNINNANNFGMYIDSAYTAGNEIRCNNFNTDNAVSLSMFSVNNTVYNNNFNSANVQKVFANIAYELSYNNVGNFWGRTSGSCFVAGTDSNRADVVDSYCSNSLIDCGIQICGNNVIEDTEVCDTSNFGGETCQGLGFTSGTLACGDSCLEYDISNCNENICGNNIREGKEQCDNSDLNGQTCASIGYGSGTLACREDCWAFDTSNCTAGCTTGMKSWWGADNDSNDAMNNNNGVWVGNESYAPGKVGDAFRFDGSANYVVANVSEINLSEAITLAAWIKPDILSSTRPIIMKQTSSATGDYQLFLSNNVLWFRLNDAAVGIKYDLSKETGQWEYVVGTYDRNNMNLYVNGVLVNSTAYTGQINNKYTQVRIGSYYLYYFNGLIDEPVIYDRALTGDEILDNYNKAGNGYCGVPPVCGNGIVDGGEVCDGGNLDGQTCESIGMTGGTLGCRDDCIAFEVSSCTPECTDRMMGLWSGENNSDDSIEGNNGAWVGNDSYSLGKVGANAFRFYGTPNYAYFPADNLYTTDALTVALWVKPDRYLTERGILHKGSSSYSGDYRLSTYYNQLWFRMNNDFVQLKTNFSPIGQWYYVVATYDRKNVSLYVNGVLMNSTEYNGTIANGFNRIYLGTYYVYYLIGSADELAVYNRALGADEILDNYNKAGNGYCGVPPVCGNGIVDGGEVCDGGNLDGQTCESIGMTGGTLGCRDDCLSFDRSGCVFSCTSGMTGWWNAERTINDSYVQDVLGNYNGTWSGVPEYAPGKFGEAYRFDGSTKSVEIDTNALNAVNELGIAVWIKPDLFSSEQGILHKGSGGYGGDYKLSLSSNVLWFKMNEDSIKMKYNLPQVGQWYHVAVSYDRQKINLYVNGVLVNSTAFDGTIANGFERVRIGAYHSYYFQGLIDEVALFDRALEESEVSDMYAKDGSGYCGTIPECGNLIVEGEEVCDRNELNGQTCTGLGFLSGDSLGCREDCLLFNNLNCTSECTTGMKSWWKAEEDLNDSIGPNSYGGLWYGTRDYVPGKVGQAFSFDGYNSYVSIPIQDNSFYSTEQIGVSAWIKPDRPLVNNQIIVSKQTGNLYSGDYQLDITSNQLWFRINNNFVKIKYNVPASGQWYHIVGTYDRNFLKLYVNGVLVNSTDYTGKLTNGYTNIRIGGTQSNYYFVGAIDEVAIFNKALSPSQVATEYSRGGKGYCAPSNPVCGNGIVDGGESCDGSNLNEGTCTSVGFEGGAINCRADCLLYNTLNCVANCTTGMKSWWKAEDNTFDEVGLNPGTWTGTPTYDAGKIGQAFSFATGRYFTSPANYLYNQNEVSLAAWIKPATIAGTQGIIQKSGTTNDLGDYHLGIVSNQLWFRLNNGAMSIKYNLPASGQWYYVVGTYDRNFIRLYVNGALVNSTAYTGTLANGYNKIRIGAYYAGNYYFNGLIDEPAVYTRALNSFEIGNLYANGEYGYCLELASPPFCGNGIVEGTEQCDVGRTNEGNNKCLLSMPGMRCADCMIQDVSAAEEVCNDVDDDCGGAIDELLFKTCGFNAVGICTLGAETCSAGNWLGCTAVWPLGHPNSYEICNGLDDDCDGETDDNLETVSCGTDTGECVSGYRTCVNGQLSACFGSIGSAPEICDGKDNDCDGLIDEGACNLCSPAGATRSCSSVCGSGVETCAGIPLVWSSCSAPQPVSETCNSLDDDCDGLVDEGGVCGICTPGDLRICGTDLGICEFGTETCNEEGQWGSCMGAVTSVTETCNGLDDDCDGTADENLVRNCILPGVGQGIEACIVNGNGSWGTCDVANPTPEICNGFDDDFDGVVDEDIIGTGVACTTVKPGVCASGTVQCVSGAIKCVSNVNASSEICGNELDEDCNGVLDNGCGGVCDTDGDGHMQSALLWCFIFGPLDDCDDENANVHPGVPELCSTPYDDNCNGQINENSAIDTATWHQDYDNDYYGNLSISVSSCYQPVGYVADSSDCNDNNANVNPGHAEVCFNGIDDDCDGSADEGCQVCGNGVIEGTEVCDGGSQSCVVGGYAGTQTCNAQCTGWNNCTTTEFCGDGIINDAEQCDIGNDDLGNNKCIDGMTDLRCNNCQIENVSAVLETCNNIDDDCGGTVDEGLTQTCGTSNIGECTLGYSTCKAGAWIACTAKQPQLEACDGKDNNCNGVADDGLIDVACGNNITGCVPGVKSCIGAQWTECTATGGTPEICDGIDNDCDEQVDEGCDTCPYLGATQNCTTSCGTGIQTCSGSPLQWGSCSVVPKAETCNGFDDNCNDIIDDGVREFCALPGGALGVRTCEVGGNGTWGACDFITPAPEICDGIDNDFNGLVDDNVAGVGVSCNTGRFGVCAVGSVQCTNAAMKCVPSTQSSPETSYEVCTDGMDNDCDGLTDLTDSDCCVDSDGDGYGTNAGAGCTYSGVDCDDANANVNPGATETCNGIDDNCDGNIDEGVKLTFYQDNDGDNYGNAAVSVDVCAAPIGYVSDSTDCDDANANVNPGADEVCNGIDDNCDGSADEGDICPATAYYCDGDSDNYISAAPSGSCNTFNCIPAGCASTQGSDCKDNNANVNPGMSEICNEVDDNCNGIVDEGVKSVFYYDSDSDNYGDVSVTLEACAAPAGYVDDSTDCNDNNANVNPGMSEICNEVDDNCNGIVDEGVKSIFYQDNDGDNYGGMNVTTFACAAPAGYVDDSTDCNDANAAINPGTAEICNGVDDNCNAEIDEGGVCSVTDYYCDADSDSYLNALPSGNCNTFNCVPAGCANTQGSDCNDADAAVNPGASEICNGIDDNCNGDVDEGVKLTFYQDSDGDNYGNPFVSIEACAAPAGHVSDSTDCNDDNAAVNPAVTEVCDNIDNNCNGAVDEGFDSDGDGVKTCEGDCNDNDAEIYPGAGEECNGIDDDCDGLTDADDEDLTYDQLCEKQNGVCSGSLKSCSNGAWQTCTFANYESQSSGLYEETETSCDGFDNDCNGVSDSLTSSCADLGWLGICGAVTQSATCTDGGWNDAAVCDVSTPETCDDETGFNEVDEDCDGAIAACGVLFCDVDGDDYYSEDLALWQKALCILAGDSGGDCNDNDGSVNPAASEMCNNVDDNCDGMVDGILRSCSENYLGICGLGEETCSFGTWAGCPVSQTETCDGRDEDCDGLSDGSESLTQQCGVSDVGVCEYGTETCNDAGSWYGCTAVMPVATDACDGLDNNCNGVVDEDKSLKFTFNQVMPAGYNNIFAGLNVYPAGPDNSVLVPLNSYLTTDDTNQPGLILDYTATSFDVGLYGKHDKVKKEAVDANIELNGLNIYTIQNIKGAPYEGLKKNNGIFGVAGRDQVDVETPTLIHMITTVTGANDEFRVNYNKITCDSSADSDGDGIIDFLDRCQNSIPDAISESKLGKNNRFADIDGDGIFEMLVKQSQRVCNDVEYSCGYGKNKQTCTKKVCHDEEEWIVADSDYSLADTYGCTCYDILAVKKGEDKEQLRSGCTDKVITDWIESRGSAITLACDDEGYDRDGYSCKDGFNKKGYDRDGYDKNGRHR